MDILQIEKKIHQITLTESKKLKSLYEDAYDEVIKELEYLYLKGEGTLSRSELYRNKKLKTIKLELEEAINNSITSALERIAHTTIDGIGFVSIKEEDVLAIVNREFKGKNFSTRVWNNTELVAQQIYKDLSRMITTGIQPDRLKENLMKRFTVAYHQADRLIRTEGNRVFNTSALESYSKAGVKQVKILDTHESCEECHINAGVIYELNSVPELPTHPNCRCCYSAIIT